MCFNYHIRVYMKCREDSSLLFVIVLKISYFIMIFVFYYFSFYVFFQVSPSEIVSVDRFDDQALASEVHSENIDVASGKVIHYSKQTCPKIKNVNVLPYLSSPSLFVLLELIFSFHDDMQEAEVSLSVCMKNDLEDPTELSLPQAAFKYLRGITASLFGFQSSILMQGFFKSTGSNDFTASNASTQCGKELTDIDETEMIKLSNLSLPINDDLEKMALDPQIDTDKVGHFNLFDMVFDFPDHHFADSISKQLVMSLLNALTFPRAFFAILNVIFLFRSTEFG